MKILHTSDWHLGQKFISRDREEEHRLALDWVAELAKYVVILLFFLSACQQPNTKKDDTALTNIQKVKKEELILPKPQIETEAIVKAPVSFYEKVDFYHRKYKSKLCTNDSFSEKEILLSYQAVKSIGKINNHSAIDSVFVLPALNFCEEGDAYYFTNTSLPRLKTDSECCDPQNIFALEDIDEDGIPEIGLFYSSCSSRYKVLYVYTLKKHKWKVAGECIYDFGYNEEGSNYKDFIKKTGKGEFKMLEITDLTDNEKFVGKPNWIKFNL